MTPKYRFSFSSELHVLLNGHVYFSLADPPGIPKGLFHASIRDFTSLVQIPDGRVSMQLEVTSSFPILIPNSCLLVKLREVDERVLSRRKQSVYDVLFSVSMDNSTVIHSS